MDRPLPDRPTVLHVFPSFGYGGAQMRTVELMNSVLAEASHLVVALDRNFDAAELVRPEVAFMPLTVEVRPSGGLDLGNLQRCRQLLAAYRPALLLTYNWGTIEAALANRFRPLCPHVHFEDGFGPEEAGGRQLRRRVWGRRLALSGQSRIVLPSRTLERIARELWRFGPGRVAYIPNGIDCARFATPQTAPLPDLRRRPEELLIATLGSLRPEKNFGRLIRLVAALRDDLTVRLVIAGDGPERAALEHRAEASGIAHLVTFTGQLDAPEALLAAADVFALSSDTEQMPYCLIEAMAAGLPVIATDVGDVRAMLPALQQPFAAWPDQEEALLVALDELLRDPDLRRELGAANQAHVRALFERSVMLERYRDLFQPLLAAEAA
jgi:glycosyltransferase involved in cell wall biosynthesis